MFRCFPRIALLAVIVAFAAAPSYALKLLSPTPDQVVREKVRITIPEKDLPPDFVVPKDEPTPEKLRPFISVLVGPAGSEKLVAAISPDAGSVKKGAVTFYWDSKSPYRDSADASTDRFFKDGRYTLKVELYDATGKKADAASVDIELKNKVARRDQPVQLVNRMVFGESHAYDVHADVQVFHMVSGTGLPILGGMGMTSDFQIVESVEDVGSDGSYLLRCRMGSEGYLGSFGQKLRLFGADEAKPQLYRIVDKLGNVIVRNKFSRQAKYSIMDVLPVLPRKAVKEGDSWPTQFDLKIEGITRVIPLTGTSQLDSFEWQGGHECAKIISTLTGSSVITMDNGRIRSSSNKVEAQVVTYFAYRSGRMLRREVNLEFPANVQPGAGQLEGSAIAAINSSSSGGSQITSISTMYSNEGEDEDETTSRTAAAKSGAASPYKVFGGPGSPVAPPGLGGSTGTSDNGEGLTKKGKVQIKLVVELEK